nr:hypothetical protein [Kibdelosporangium sp. MJ126-NF4]
MYPSVEERRSLVLPHSLTKIIRWQRYGPVDDRPTAITAEWIGEPEWRDLEFTFGYPGAPIVSRRVADLLREDLETAGTFVPVRIDGTDTDDYLLYLVDKVVDCVDTRRSSKPKRNGEIKKTIFLADALPFELPAFRVPESPAVVQWNGWMADRLLGLFGDDLAARLVWSADSALTPHHNPWGF